MLLKVFFIAALVGLSQGKPKPYLSSGCAASCPSSTCTGSPCGAASLSSFWPSLSSAYSQFPSPSYTSAPLASSSLPVQYGSNVQYSGQTVYPSSLQSTQLSSLSSPSYSGQAAYPVFSSQASFPALPSVYPVPSQSQYFQTSNLGSSSGQTYAPSYQASYQAPAQQQLEYGPLSSTSFTYQPSSQQNVDYGQLSSAYGQNYQTVPLQSQPLQVLPAQTFGTTQSETSYLYPSSSANHATSYDTSGLKSAALTALPATYAQSYSWSNDLSNVQSPTVAQLYSAASNSNNGQSNSYGVIPAVQQSQQSNSPCGQGSPTCPLQNSG